MAKPGIIVQGKNNGEGMVIDYKTTKGTHVFGLAMPNIYTDTDWDLGPTWCYLIVGQETTLIDTGRFGNFKILNTLMKSTGKEIQNIDRIIITHSHEDHDGNLAEILSVTQAKLWAYSTYRSMISYYPHIRDGATHPELPGSCRFCPMPKKFYKDCLPYHEKRSLQSVDYVIGDGQRLPDSEISFVFTPGHTPDSICIILENEVIFTGDTILPDITPHPSLVYEFEVNRHILPEEYRQTNMLYGLMFYIKSLNKISSLSCQPIKYTLPAHRLFYNGQLNIIHKSSQRAKAIIQFHIDRCRDIWNNSGNKPSGIKDITTQYFPPSRLAGTGKLMAEREVIAHIEIMQECGDICYSGQNGERVLPTGSNKFVDVLGQYLNS